MAPLGGGIHHMSRPVGLEIQKKRTLYADTGDGGSFLAQGGRG